jgi:hypothetical protein
VSADLERALISLQTGAHPEEMDGEQRRQLFLGDAELVTVGDALRIMTSAAGDPSMALDRRFATAQALYLGVRIQREQDDLEVGEELHGLAASLLRSVGASAAISAADSPVDPAGILLESLTDLMGIAEGEALTAHHLAGLERAFGSRLAVTGTLAEGDVELSGPAAALTLLLLEFFTNGLNCVATPGRVDVGGEMKDVIFVEVDVCTNQPFAKCRRGINPLHWDDCNPFFLSVEVRGSVTPLTDGWAAVVKERVGSPFNGQVYETDLAVTMTEQDKMSTVAFDLAPDEVRTDPRMVTVDRGFVSASDEGAHRRIRVLKVYRIEDFKLPQKWLCPLWASQVAMSPWWCP